MRLHHWSSARWDFEFDPATGSTRLLRLSAPHPDPSPVQGFGAFERSLSGRRIPFAVYRVGDELYFSAARRRWDLAEPGLAFSHHRFGPVSRFRVLESGRIVYSCWYGHAGRLLLEAIDPTHNLLDEEHDYFLQFVAANAASPAWQDSVRARWMPHPAARGKNAGLSAGGRVGGSIAVPSGATSHVPLSPDTRSRLEALFSGPEREAASRLLITGCGSNLPFSRAADPRALERIRFAVLKLSNGDMGRLESAVALAQIDWRDVLVAASFGDDVRAHRSWFP